MWIQLGYRKYCCFPCEWDKRAYYEHHSRQIWPRRINFIPKNKNIISTLLVKPENIPLPVLHIKLGLIKNFVKRLTKDGPASLFLKTLFLALSEAKTKEGFFVGLQI